jgi:hypothetical protein
MFKKLLNNPIDVIGNAVEINKYKMKRSTLEDEKRDCEKKCRRYDEHISFKNHIATVTVMNANTINKLRTIFASNNVEYDMSYSDFEIQYEDNEHRIYKKLYDTMNLSNSVINETTEQINKVIGVDKQVYLDRIAYIEGKLVEVNQKLRNVRDKQFGKKNANVSNVPPPPPAPVVVEEKKEANLIEFDAYYMTS